ncbi:GNAT family N-acetyltransferase [bacterium]|nr:GNAT family N-acetyltransferase [bacterium]
MDNLVSRAACEADLPRLCAIWDECFSVGHDYFLTCINNLPGRDWNDSRILEKNGEILSALNLYRIPVRFGAAVLSMGGIGDVCTPAAHRKHGYSSRLLADAQAYLVARGCSLSYLYSGLTSFYGRAGWSPVAMPWARLIRWQETARDATIRAAREQDVAALDAIYHSFFAPCVGWAERSPEYWRRRVFSELHRLDVAERDGRIVAYALSDVLPDRHGGFKEAACLPGQEAAAGALLTWLAERYRPAKTGRRGHFLLDLMLAQDLQGLHNELMAMVLDWDLFAQQMQSEFQRRLAGRRLRLALAVDNPARPGGLLFENGQASALRDRPPDLALSSTDFWKLLSGQARVDDLLPHLSPLHFDLLSAAFPPVEFFYSNGDYF